MLFTLTVYQSMVLRIDSASVTQQKRKRPMKTLVESSKKLMLLGVRKGPTRICSARKTYFINSSAEANRLNVLLGLERPRLPVLTPSYLSCEAGI